MRLRAACEVRKSQTSSPCGRRGQSSLEDLLWTDQQSGNLQRRDLFPAEPELYLTHLDCLAQRQAERLVLVRIHHEPGTHALVPVFLQDHRVDKPAGLSFLVSELHAHRNRAHIPDDAALVAV